MTRIDPIQTIDQERGPRSRSFASKVAIFATVAALAIAPALVTGTAANAAEPIVVTSPADGATGVQQSLPAVVQFTGTGLPAEDYASVSYLDATGVQRNATFGGSQPTAEPGGWTGGQNFGQLSPGQTQVVATVVALNSQTGVQDPEVTPATVTFSFAFAPIPSNPLTVTSPTSGQVVTDTTPTFTGTGNPGSTITITYSKLRLFTGVAAENVIVQGDGTWTTDTTFAELEPGETDVRATVRQFNPDGTPVAGQEQTLVDFVFAESPAPLDPLTVTTEPGTVTQAQASSTGVAFLATGFSPNEELTIAITDQNGGAVNVPQAGPFFSDDTDGTFVGVVLLPTTAGTGTYTITVNGVRSARTAAGTFAVVANPVTPGTPGAPGSLPVVSG